MTDTRGGPSKETDRPPQSTARAELAYFSFGCVALTIATVLLLFEQGRNVHLPRGLYAILAAGIVLGGVGWTVVWSVGRAEERVRAMVECDLQETSTRLAELISTVQALTAQSRVAYLPTAHRHPVGHRYMGAAAVGAESDTLPLGRGLDPKTIADARSIARRLVDADTLSRQDQDHR